LAKQFKLLWITDWIVLVIKTTSAASIILSKSLYEGRTSNSDLRILVLTTWVVNGSDVVTYEPEDEEELKEDPEE
jgi:ribosomal protein S12